MIINRESNVCFIQQQFKSFVGLYSYADWELSSFSVDDVSTLFVSIMAAFAFTILWWTKLNNILSIH